jgi:hypothetical protein
MDQVKGEGLSFYPLYWAHHDCWQFFLPDGHGGFIQRLHYGHAHLFLLSFDYSNANGDAFSGRQAFNFEIKDDWGPRSPDPNQMLPYRVVGTPKWSFHVQEMWRRMYVQPWDQQVKMPDGLVVGRRGVKWDACAEGMRHGPYREGQGYAPMFLEGARTLPLEYWNNELRRRGVDRDNYVRTRAQGMLATYNANPLPSPFPQNIPFVDDEWNLNHDADVVVPHPAAVPTFPDGLYIYPIIEYKTVTQLDWQRPHGFEQHDKDDEHFGDGWSQQVTVPYTNPITGLYNSPFSPAPGQVRPIGEYFGINKSGQPLVKPEDYPKFRKREEGVGVVNGVPAVVGYDGQHEPFGMPEVLSEQPMTFQNPYGITDGRWVQQCLGGIVQARAVVTIEHKLGGREDITVGATQLVTNTPFAGSDQLVL